MERRKIGRKDRHLMEKKIKKTVLYCLKNKNYNARCLSLLKDVMYALYFQD